MVKRTIIYFIFLLASINICYAQPTDSLKQILTHSEGHRRIEILHELILSVWLNYPEQGMVYGKEALELSNSLNDSTNISKSLRLLAGVRYYKGDYNKSLDLNLQALKIAEIINDSILINSGYNNIGLLYYNLGSYQSALEFLLKARANKERASQINGLPTTLNNIGLVYERISNFEMARKYFFEALVIAQKQNIKNQIVYSQNNIGSTYLRENNFVAAKKYFTKSLILADKIENFNWGAVSLRGLGEVLVHNQQFDSAIINYQKALDASKNIDDKKGISEAYYLFSKVEYLKGNSQQAIEYLKKGHAIAKKIEIRQQMLENLKLYIKIYQGVMDQDKIIEYQEAYLKLKDSLFQDVVTRNLNLVPIKIKEEEDRLKIPKQQAEIRRKDFNNNVLLMILLFATPLIVVLIILILKNVSKNNKLTLYNNEILSQKEELEKAKYLIHEQKNELEILNVDLSHTVDRRTNELKDANEELRITYLELDNLIYKSAHDIRGPLLRLIGVCNLALMEVEEKKAIEYFKMIDKASKRLNNTVDKLKVITELNHKKTVSEPIDFLSIINHNLDQNKYIEGLEDITLESDIEKNLTFNSDPAVIDLIIFNMIQNAVQLLKVSNISSKKIKIGIKKDADHLIMNFDIENIDSIIGQHEDFYKILAKDDDVNQSLGIGLYTVKQCVQKLGGKLLLLGDIIQATHFVVNLPLLKKQ